MTFPLPWETREPRLKDVLEATFPSASGSEVSSWSRAIGDGYSTAFSLQSVERLDRDPKKDRESLISAAKALERAASHLSAVGWHGGKVLESLGFEQRRLDPHSSKNYPINIVGAKAFYSCELRGLAERLREDAKAISDDAPSVNSAFGDGPEFQRHSTKPLATAAKFTARECARAYSELSGRRPTVPKKDGVAYGAFLEFVRGVFLALDLTESAETWATDAKDWFRDADRAHIQKSPKKN